MRVLHLIDPDSPDGGPCTLRLLGDVTRRVRTADHHVLILGGRRAVETSRRCGIKPDAQFSPSRYLPWTASASLREFGESMQYRGKRVDLVHAWTARAAAQAWHAWRGSPPVLATVHAGFKSDLVSRYSMRTLVRSEIAILAASIAVRRQFRAAGVAAHQVALLPPALDANAGVVDRSTARARLAEAHEISIAEDDFVIGLFAEPMGTADALMAATIAARLSLAGRSVKLLVHPAAARRIAAHHQLKNLKLDHILIVDPVAAEPWRIIRGIDAALFLTNRQNAKQPGSILPVLWAIATGTPLIAETSDATHDVLDGNFDDLLIAPGDINAACDRLLDLLGDSSQRQTIAAQARQLADDLFGIDDYCERLQHAYDLLLAHRTIRWVGDSSQVAEIASEETIAA